MFRYNSEYVAIITSITHCVNSNNIAFQYNNDDCYSKNSLKTQILNERSKVPQIANSLAKLTVNNFTELKRPLQCLNEELHITEVNYSTRKRITEQSAPPSPPQSKSLQTC